jgi:hypothetical protein
MNSPARPIAGTWKRPLDNVWPIELRKGRGGMEHRPVAGVIQIDRGSQGRSPCSTWPRGGRVDDRRLKTEQMPVTLEASRPARLTTFDHPRTAPTGEPASSRTGCLPPTAASGTSKQQHSTYAWPAVACRPKGAKPDLADVVRLLFFSRPIIGARVLQADRTGVESSTGGRSPLPQPHPRTSADPKWPFRDDPQF